MEQKNNVRNNDFAAVCVIYLCALLSFVVLRVANGLGWFSILSVQAADVVFSVLSQILVMFLIPFVGYMIYKRRSKPKTNQNMTFAEFSELQEKGGCDSSRNEQSSGKSILKYWGFNRTSGKVIGCAFLLGVLLFFFNVFVSGFFNGILTVFGYRFPSGGESAFTGVTGLFIALVLIAVLPGICEETAHRGLLMRGFASRLGIMKAVLFSSVIFGLMHLNIVQCFYAAILGYLMALAALATRTIWTAVIMHFVNNGIGTYISFARPNGWFGGDMLVNLSNFLAESSFLFFIVFFVVLYFIIIAIIHAFARENYIKDCLHTEGGPQIPSLRGSKAIRYYLTAGENPVRESLRPIEKALVCGIIFLGAVVTLMTLVWGFL